MTAGAPAQSVSPEAVVAIRVLAGLSQTALATAAGIDRTQLWRIEAGQAEPYPHTLEQLARALKVPVSALVK